jgi:predicted flavoprotein YhiN
MTAATGNTGYHVVVVSGGAAGCLAAAVWAKTGRAGCYSPRG